MHDKQTKWGVKVWVLADARNGYVKKFEVYNGKGKGNQSRVGLCSRVVLNLMEGLHNSGLHLYTDNFSTSPLLFHHYIGEASMHVELYCPTVSTFHKISVTSTMATTRGSARCSG